MELGLDIKRKPQQHLINILRSTSQHHPNFTLFLGAGASITSGIKPAQELISEWREVYSEMHGFEKLVEQHWYEKVNEYSELFESLYDQPSQRREFIETCIEEGVPSWGYIYLVNLLIENCFNTVFTTNFDDLLNEACYSYSKNLRPIVSAHDSSITSIRLTSSRPKIIKLHGDFLFDNIKNTIRELESLEDNMRAKFKQFATEFGMIVIGYAGNDRSIMDTLNTLLHTDRCFPHGIYWCVMKGAKLSGEVENLSRFPRFHIVEIEGFDDFFAELHDSLGLRLQQEVSNPYAALASKLDSFVEKINDDKYNQSLVIERDRQDLSRNIQNIFSANSVIKKLEETINNANVSAKAESNSSEYINSVLKQLENDIQIVRGEDDNPEINTIPHALLAAVAFHEERFDDALEYSLKALKTRVSIDAISTGINAIIHLDRMDQFKFFKDQLLKVKRLGSKQVSNLISTVVELISGSKYEEAIKLLDTIEIVSNFSDESHPFLVLNRALAMRLLGQDIPVDLEDDLTQQLDLAIDRNDNWLGFGLAICLGNSRVAIELVNNFDLYEAEAILSRDMPILKGVEGNDLDEITNALNFIVASSENFDVDLEISENVVHIDRPKTLTNGEDND